MRNGPQILRQLSSCHADPVICKGQRLRCFIGGNIDLQGKLIIEDILLRQLQETHLLKCIRGIRHQFTNKYFAIGIKGVNNYIQELSDFSLEFVGMGFLSAHRRIFIFLVPNRGADDKHEVPDVKKRCGKLLDAAVWKSILGLVLRTQLKSKLHRATVTDANVAYEGSITIPTDLMRAADLWVGEKVLVTSITNGARLETYIIEGAEGSGQIVINGAAAHLINKGHLVTIMAWGIDDKPIIPKRWLLDKENKAINNTVI